jgi:H+/Cl- antiporter ClcA
MSPFWDAFISFIVVGLFCFFCATLLSQKKGEGEKLKNFFVRFYTRHKKVSALIIFLIVCVVAIIASHDQTFWYDLP